MATGNNPNTVEQKDRSLEMLYSIVASINIIDDQEKLCLRILEILKNWIGARGICLYRSMENNNLVLVASLGFKGTALRIRYPGGGDSCPCSTAIAKGHIQDDLVQRTCCSDLASAFTDDEPLRLLSVPVQTRNRVFGVINLLVLDKELEVDEDWMVLLTSIGQNLGLAIERSELEEGARRLSRMEERNFLAHELHDSLAQTLASIRYHIRILENAYKSGEDSKVLNMIDLTESNIDEANRELRELISRFRAPMDRQGVIRSIENVIQRFKEETGIKIVFQNKVGNINLPDNFELQVTRIVQEALANIKKHAKSRTVRVMLSADNNAYQLLVEDDGRGFSVKKEPERHGEHVGLLVMSERAARIGGELNIESVRSEGTRVHLVFPCPD